MRTRRLRGLLILPLVVTLAGACGASNNGGGASPANSRKAGVSATPTPDRVSATPSPGDVRATPSPSRAGSRLYTDPDGAFALNLAADWQVERAEAQGGYMTTVRPPQEGAANLSILTIKAAPPKTDDPELQAFTLSDSSGPFFQGWVDGLREQARVEGGSVFLPTRLDDVSGLRTDVTYYRGDANDPRRGRAIYLIGDHTTFFVSLTASSQRFGELEEIVSTLRIEP
jgi:hypothetical protein